MERHWWSPRCLLEKILVWYVRYATRRKGHGNQKMVQHGRMVAQREMQKWILAITNVSFEISHRWWRNRQWNKHCFSERKYNILICQFTIWNVKNIRWLDTSQMNFRILSWKLISIEKRIRILDTYRMIPKKISLTDEIARITRTHIDLVWIGQIFSTQIFSSESF